MADREYAYLHEDLEDAERSLDYFRGLVPSDEEDINDRRKQAMDDIKERIKELREEIAGSDTNRKV